MSRIERAVMAFYFLLLAACVLWVPWHAQLHGSEYSRYAGFENMGYGWLWRGPATQSSSSLLYATPDIRLIALRVLAITSVCAAFFAAVHLGSGYRRNSRQ